MLKTGFGPPVILLFLIPFSNHSPLISVESLRVQFAPAFVPPENILPPSHSKSAREKRSTETPLWVVRESPHSYLLSCSLQLLSNAPFLYLTLLFREEQWRHHTHSFPTLPPSPLFDCQDSFLGGTEILCCHSLRAKGPCVALDISTLICWSHIAPHPFAFQSLLKLHSPPRRDGAFFHVCWPHFHPDGCWRILLIFSTPVAPSVTSHLSCNIEHFPVAPSDL